MKKLYPSLTQWKKWKLPSKLTAIGAYVGIIAFVLSIIFYLFPRSGGYEPTLPPLPGGTGWLTVGTYDSILNKYIKGPYYEVFTPISLDQSDLPQEGDVVRINRERKLIIVDYKTDGIEKAYLPPGQKKLDDDDYTGIRIPRGCLVEVRNVNKGSYFAGPFKVWVKIRKPSTD